VTGAAGVPVPPSAGVGVGGTGADPGPDAGGVGLVPDSGVADVGDMGTRTVAPPGGSAPPSGVGGFPVGEAGPTGVGVIGIGVTGPGVWPFPPAAGSGLAGANGLGFWSAVVPFPVPVKAGGGLTGAGTVPPVSGFLSSGWGVSVTGFVCPSPKGEVTGLGF